MCYSFVKSKISLAPNNDSAWNYLRGILNHSETSFTSQRDFTIPYTVPQLPSTPILDLDNPLPSSDSELPCPAALEFLAEIHEGEQSEQGIQNAVLVPISMYLHCERRLTVTQLYKQLAEQDPIRKL